MTTSKGESSNQIHNIVNVYITTYPISKLNPKIGDIEQYFKEYKGAKKNYKWSDQLVIELLPTSILSKS